jgi:hypothetical protein
VPMKCNVPVHIIIFNVVSTLFGSFRLQFVASVANESTFAYEICVYRYRWYRYSPLTYQCLFVDGRESLLGTYQCTLVN